LSIASFTVQMKKELSVLATSETHEQRRQNHQPRLPDVLGLSNTAKTNSQKS
jgi:hypothetical protein